MIEFMSFKDDLTEEILQLLGNRSIKRQLWHWQYNANPLATNGSPGVVMVIDNQIAGFKGTMHVRVKMGHHFVNALWNNDTYVNNKYRGKGFGGKLIEKIESIWPVALAYGISDMQFPIFMKRGWRINLEVEEYFFQNKITTSKDLLKVLVQTYAIFKKKGASPSYSIKDISARDIPRESDELWELLQSEYDKIVIRNYEYLKWKYGDHPSQSYRALLAYDCGELLAIAIYRGTKDLGRFVDYLGPVNNVGLKEQLIATFMEACKNSNKLNIITTDEQFKQCLNRFGFRKYGTLPRFCIFTKLPINHFEKGWFLMAGDSDGDLIDAMTDSM